MGFRFAHLALVGGLVLAACSGDQHSDDPRSSTGNGRNGGAGSGAPATCSSSCTKPPDGDGTPAFRDAGQKALAELATRETALRQTLLRISGAIQVLEEELKAADPASDTS